MPRSATATTCPRCGGPSIPVVYGLPDMELFRASDRGEVALGGCTIELTADGAQISPGRACVGEDCGIWFGAASAASG